ncbi:MAG: hypothetical protein ABSH48_05035 [Verrucomicrobiota bacterium]|jgi:hypothetical protein
MHLLHEVARDRKYQEDEGFADNHVLREAEFDEENWKMTQEMAQAIADESGVPPFRDALDVSFDGRSRKTEDLPRNAGDDVCKMHEISRLHVAMYWQALS